MGIFGFVSAALSFRVTLIDDLEIWVPLIFLLFGILGLWYFVLLSETVSFETDAVTLQRFGKMKYIPFHEISHIEDGSVSYRLIIHGHHEKIIVEKQLVNFPVFHELLIERAPSNIKEDQALFPLVAKMATWLYVAQALFVFIGFIVFYFTVRDNAGAAGFILAASISALGVFSFVFVPRSFYFDRTDIILTYIFGEKTYSWRDLEDLQVDRRPMYGGTLFFFKFRNGSFILNFMQVNRSEEGITTALSSFFNEGLAG